MFNWVLLLLLGLDVSIFERRQVGTTGGVELGHLSINEVPGDCILGAVRRVVE
jgi:hypothetical protein